LTPTLTYRLRTGKVEVRDKLGELHKKTDAGLRPRRRYTVGDALEDWLAHGVDGLSERTVTLYRGTIAKALNEEIGKIRMTELTAPRAASIRMTNKSVRFHTLSCKRRGVLSSTCLSVAVTPRPVGPVLCPSVLDLD